MILDCRPRLFIAVPHPWLRETLCHLLHDLESEVVGVQTWDDLLGAIQQPTTAAVVDLFGFQQPFAVLLDELRQHAPGTAIIALLSTDTIDYRDAVVRAGANAVIVKENAYEDLIPSIVQVLNGKRYSTFIADLLKKQKSLIELKAREAQVMEKEKQRKGDGLSRRSFLKVSAATGASAALVHPDIGALRNLVPIDDERQLQTNADEEQIFRGVCRPNCFGYCPLNVHVRDGKIVKTSMAPHADPKYNRICLRGLSHVQRIYSEDRIKYPMRRVGERGEDQWERISWDEATTIITDKWKETQEQYGKQAVSFLANSGSISVMGYSFQRLYNALEGTLISADVDMASSVGINRVVGNVGLWVGNESSDVVNAKTIIAWGCNLTEATIHNWHFVADALEQGAKLITIDPVYTITASKSDKFVPVRPGTDPALTLSLIQVIISESLHNVEFLLAHTVAPFLVRDDTKEFLRMSDLGVEPQEGPADAAGNPTVIDPPAVWDPDTNTAVAVGTIDTPALEGAFEVEGFSVRTAFELLKEEVNQYPPEEASQITDISAEDIIELARICAEPPVFHVMGWGPQAYVNGVHAAHALATLAAVTGNIGYPGASVGSNWQIYPGLNWAFTFPSFTFGKGLSQFSLREVVKTGTFKGEDYPIKTMYVCIGNPASVYTDTNAWIDEVLPTLDLIVVADPFMTDTARYADIVLPVTDWFEHADVTIGGQTHYLMYSEKAIEPLYESKTDLEIVTLLAEKMGVGEYLQISEEELLAEALASPMSEELGISLESLRENKAMRYLKDPYIAWEGNSFATPSGRMEFYVEKPTPRVPTEAEMDVDRERLPRFFPPNEAWHENPLFAKYPLVLLSERPKFRVHSQWSGTPWLRELDPEPIVKINPSDARNRGISHDDLVEVYNDRGNAVVRAKIANGLKPGVMVFPKSWQRQQYIAGDLGALSSAAFDPCGVNQNFMDELVEVRKWDGEA